MHGIKHCLRALALIAVIVIGGTMAYPQPTLQPDEVYPDNIRPTIRSLIPIEATGYLYTHDYRYLLGIQTTGVAVLDPQQKHNERYPLLTYLPHQALQDVQDFVWNYQRYVVTVGGGRVRVWNITNPAQHTVASARLIGANNRPYFSDERVAVLLNSQYCRILVGGLKPSEIVTLEFNGSSLSLVGTPSAVGAGLGVITMASYPAVYDTVAVGTYGGTIELYTLNSSGSVISSGKLSQTRNRITSLSFIPNSSPRCLMAKDDTERLYLWRIASPQPIAVLAFQSRANNNNLYTVDPNAHPFSRRFHFSPSGEYASLKLGRLGVVGNPDHGVLTWLRVRRNGQEIQGLQVVGSLQGSWFSLYGRDDTSGSDFLFAAGSGGDAWLDRGMTPLSYAEAPWEVAHPLPANTGVGTAVAASPPGALVGTSQGRLFFYQSTAVQSASYTPIGLGSNTLGGVIHSAVYLGANGNSHYYAVSYGDGKLRVVEYTGTALVLRSEYSLPSWGALCLGALSVTNGSLLAVGGSASGILSIWRWSNSSPNTLTELTDTDQARWAVNRVIRDIAWNPQQLSIGLALRRAVSATANFSETAGFSNTTVSVGNRNGEGVAWNGNTLDVVYSVGSSTTGYQVRYVPDTFRSQVRHRMWLNLDNRSVLRYRYNLGYAGDVQRDLAMVSEDSAPAYCIRFDYGVRSSERTYAVAVTARGNVVFFLTPPIGYRGDFPHHQFGYLNSYYYSVCRDAGLVASASRFDESNNLFTTFYTASSTNSLGYIHRTLRNAYFLHPVRMSIGGQPRVLVHSRTPQLQIFELDPINFTLSSNPLQTITERAFHSTSWNGQYLVTARWTNNNQPANFQVHRWNNATSQFVVRGGTISRPEYTVTRNVTPFPPICFVSDDGSWVAVFYWQNNQVNLDLYQWSGTNYQFSRTVDSVSAPLSTTAPDYAYGSNLVNITLYPVYPFVPSTHRLLVGASNQLRVYDPDTGQFLTNPTFPLTTRYGFGTSQQQLRFYLLTVDQQGRPELRVYNPADWSIIATYDREGRADGFFSDKISYANILLRPVGGDGFFIWSSSFGLLICESP